MKIDKYLYTIKNTIKEANEFRVNHFLSFLVVLLPLIFIVFLWEKIYTSRQFIGTFSKSEMLSYYILVVIFGDILFPTVNYDVAKDIKEGTISYIILKPISYPLYTFFIKIGVSGSYFLISIISTALFIFLMKIHLIMPSIINFLFFILSIIFSFCIGYLLSFILSIIAFWTEEISGVSIIVDSVIPILSGMLFPISILPQKICLIIKILPFWLIINFPLEVYMGNFALITIIKILLLQIIWIIFLSIILKIMWKSGLKKYTAVGG